MWDYRKKKSLDTYPKRSVRALFDYLRRKLFWIGKMKIMVQKQTVETIVDIYNPYTVIQKLREMSPKEFEESIAMLFEIRGYVIIQQASRKKVMGHWIPKRDRGIDLIVTKDGKTKYIQIKKLTVHEVGSPMVRDFYGAVVDRLTQGDEAIFLTTSVFSKDARDFAKEKGIKILDYSDILKQIDHLGKEHKEAIENYLNAISTIDNLKYKKYAKTCRTCYAPLVKRRGKFYGCMNYYFTGCQYREEI